MNLSLINLSIKCCGLLFFLLFFLSNVQSQDKQYYELDLKRDGSLIVATLGLTAASLIIENKNDVITSLEISLLNSNDVNAFDRLAIDQFSLSARTGI